VAGSLVLAAAVGLTAFAGFARSSFVVGPARVSVSARPSFSGSTEVALPPFGAILAGTHTAPLDLRVALDEVDLPQLEQLAMGGIPDRATLDGFVEDIRLGVLRAVFFGLLAAVVAAGFAGWALRHRWRMVTASALVGLLVPGALVAWANVGFDQSAFETPTFRGAVSYAPSVIALVETRMSRVDSLRDQIGKLTRDLASYYAAPQSFASAGALGGTYRVLHVTDLHLDPVGLQLAQNLADDFDVSLVIDTGDINHYGTDVEAGVLLSVLPTDTPRIYVPGNHDSPAVVRAMGAVPNVTVIDEAASVEVDGVRVFGIPDPSASTTGVEPRAGDYADIAKREARALSRAIRSGEPTPALVAVHAREAAEPFEGLVPLVVSGHSHSADLSKRGGTWFLDSGTTGGVHFSDLRTDPHIPHTASVLYYTQARPRRLVAIDSIEVFGLEGQSSLKRTIVAEELLPVRVRLEER